MNIFLRVLLAVYAFCLTIISVITMLITFRYDILDRIYFFLNDDVLQVSYNRFIMLIIAFVFFILSLTFLLSGFKSNKDKKAVSKHTNIGEIKISLDSIESIALATARKFSGVKETKAYVRKLENSVSISIRTVVMADVNIPDLSEEIQKKVKKAVEESAGIGVNDVKVMVENIYSGTAYKPRVE